MLWKGDLSGLERLRAPTGNRPEELHTEDRFLAKLLLRKYDEAEKILREDPREAFPSGSGPGVPKSLLFGELYLARKDMIKAREYFEAARPAIEHLVEQKPLDADNHMLLGGVYAGLGRKKDAIREGQRATEILPESHSAWFGAQSQIELARIYARVGEVDRALPMLAHLLAEPSDLHAQYLRFAPEWDSLRNAPQFQQLLKQYGAGGTPDRR